MLDNLALACKACNADRVGLSILAYMAKRAARADIELALVVRSLGEWLLGSVISFVVEVVNADPNHSSLSAYAFLVAAT